MGFYPFLCKILFTFHSYPYVTEDEGLEPPRDFSRRGSNSLTYQLA